MCSSDNFGQFWTVLDDIEALPSDYDLGIDGRDSFDLSVVFNGRGRYHLDIAQLM